MVFQGYEHFLYLFGFYRCCVIVLMLIADKLRDGRIDYFFSKKFHSNHAQRERGIVLGDQIRDAMSNFVDNHYSGKVENKANQIISAKQQEYEEYVQRKREETQKIADEKLINMSK
eukprot:TRINITY_DN1387_c0_g1_i2.p1 TRINITY_DN1387_c0_g1~~TRINITY_DN1387_c0_g1_i2.p1  ORF type:complete len:116 (+),score=32.40 TRINITY_DN1387_c0_g1_i2:363-710(+)